MRTLHLRQRKVRTVPLTPSRPQASTSLLSALSHYLISVMLYPSAECVWCPAVIEPAEVLTKIRAFLLEFAEELFQRSRVLDIPVVMFQQLFG